MIHIYHGTDIVSSRKAFIDKRDESSLSFDAETASVEEILQSLEGSGLFSSENKVFIENLFSKKSSSILKTLSATLDKTKNLDVYLWEGAELSNKTLSSFKDAHMELFKLPQNLFSFLDSIRPGNNQSVTLFHKTLEETDENIILFMLIRQFRLLLAVSYDVSGIEETKRMAPWQQSKLKRQAEYFGEERLKKAFRNLQRLDKAHKTGELTMSPSQSIDFFLLDL